MGWIGWLAVLLLAAAPAGPPPAHGDEATMPRVSARLRGDKPAYAPGEPITLTLRVGNETDAPIVLTFRTAQRFDVVVSDAAGRDVWRWATGRMFAQAMGRETIPPSGALVYTARIETKLAPGAYLATGVVTAQEGRLTASVALRVEPR